MTHPLTDAELHDKFNGYREEGWCNSIYDPDDMRAAADWQLEQVIAFIEREVQWIGSNVYEIGQGDREFTQNLRQAMRPNVFTNK